MPFSDEHTSHRIGIVGIGCIFPDGPDKESYWDNIVHKKYSITEVPPERWKTRIYYDPDPSAPDKTYSKLGAFISGFTFKPENYRIPPKIAKNMDVVQKWAISAAEQALKDAGIPTDGKERQSGKRIQPDRKIYGDRCCVRFKPCCY